MYARKLPLPLCVLCGVHTWVVTLGCTHTVTLGITMYSSQYVTVQRSMSLYHFLIYMRKNSDGFFVISMHTWWSRPLLKLLDSANTGRMLPVSPVSWVHLQVAFCLCWLTSGWSILSKFDVNVFAYSKVLVLNFMHCFQTGESAAADNIEWFIEDPAFSQSNYLAPPTPPPLPLPSVSSTGDTQEDWERKTGEGEGGGWGAKSYDRKKPGPL
jgi:hypothetical protein